MCQACSKASMNAGSLSCGSCAVRVFAAATHSLFMGDASAVLADSALQGIVVTDTVSPFRLDEGRAKAKLSTLSCTGLFAKAIQRLHGGGSIVELMDA
ncbi:MAG TPA: hypothetical protein VM571_05230 [Noviherbaspirillum sp.]|nr:hypothetical protein [Noviherbaspirillum sp.]